MIGRALAGLALASLVAVVAHRVRSLSRSGAGVAVAVGTVAAAAGWTWCAAILAFFVSTSALSRWRAAFKDRATREIIATPGPRDGWQVLANGGVFVGAAAGSLLARDTAWLVIALGALAASAADTWATEIGTAVGGPPRNLRGWRVVPRGTSGAVSAWGSVGMLGGAAFMALVAYVAVRAEGAAWAVLAAGVTGALVDTILGATIQEERWCPRCQRGTERHVHSCGTSTQPHRGIAGFANNAVNLCSTIAGAFLAWACWRAWS